MNLLKRHASIRLDQLLLNARLQRVLNLAALVVIAGLVAGVAVLCFHEPRQRLLGVVAATIVTDTLAASSDHAARLDPQALADAFNRFAVEHPDRITAFVGALDVTAIESVMQQLIATHPDTMAALINQMMVLIRTGFYSELELRSEDGGFQQ